MKNSVARALQMLMNRVELSDEERDSLLRVIVEGEEVPEVERTTAEAMVDIQKLCYDLAAALGSCPEGKAAELAGDIAKEQAQSVFDVESSANARVEELQASIYSLQNQVNEKHLAMTDAQETAERARFTADRLRSKWDATGPLLRLLEPVQEGARLRELEQPESYLVQDPDDRDGRCHRALLTDDAWQSEGSLFKFDEYTPVARFRKPHEVVEYDRINSTSPEGYED